MNNVILAIVFKGKAMSYILGNTRDVDLHSPVYEYIELRDLRSIRFGHSMAIIFLNQWY